jgi:methyltransferase (TIGR00027 family)
LAIFELDQSPTQRLKIASLEKVGIDVAHVHFVPVDFSQEQVFDKLNTAGYDPGKKTLFLWEGVTLYLTETDVRKTMQEIRENAAEGSVVIADLYAERFVKTGRKGGKGRKALEYTGEGFDFGLPFSEAFEATLSDFLRSEKMDPGESFFLGKRNKKGPFAVVAEFSVR